MKPMNEKWGAMLQRTGKYRYVLLVFLLGLVLMLLPTKSEESRPPSQATPEIEEEPGGFSVEREEKHLSAILSEIRGAGDCQVLLAVESTEETQLASDDGETVVLSGGNGRENTVTIRSLYPEYLGAVIVSSGANDPNVRYELLSAVMTYTGLRSDEISISAMDDNE